MSVTLASWRDAWRALGADDGDEALFRQLVAAYSEPHRHYHTLQHLRECLEHFDAVRTLAQRPAEIGIGLWFHDAVYDAHRKDNEERSAVWARDSLLEAGLSLESAQRVHALVMATKHDGVPADGDTMLLVDADLAILGAPVERFDESDAQIRKEYAHVALEDFKSGRCSVQRSFLDRPRIYATEWFADRFEAQARENLQRAIDRWRAS